eukprot:NODE_1948_length_2328_cov_7.100409.p1 GENE.NODE_1948_length_2328_cov_7.100409~~NODE_1948_length_2328_cov_7.100409.p1  ORF type:complete len:411 (-),score=125.34 NODE_1948_length_2328_cov_7.100409:872-2104(-)
MAVRHHLWTKVQPSQSQDGIVNDYRGHPLTSLRELAPSVTHPSSIDVRRRPARGPNVRHRHRVGKYEATFRDVAHVFQGVVDRPLLKSIVADGQRGHCIRGVAEISGEDLLPLATVTSIGVLGGSMREWPGESKVDEEEEESEASTCPKVEPTSVALGILEYRAGPSDIVAAAMEAARHTPVEPGDEPWRMRRAGRGVPVHELPRSQGIANTLDATARLLEQRVDITEVPDLPDENFLKALFRKKEDWLFSPAGMDELHSVREVEKERLQACGSVWTPTGRYICTALAPPRHAVPPCRASTFSAAVTAPSSGVAPSAAVTRSEHTARQLIEAARKPKAAGPNFAIVAGSVRAGHDEALPLPPPPSRGGIYTPRVASARLPAVVPEQHQLHRRHRLLTGNITRSPLQQAAP